MDIIKNFKLFEHKLFEYRNPDISGSVVHIENEKGETLLLKRGKKSRLQGWCLPGGRIDEGEEPKTAAIRELKEESGIKVKDVKYVGIGQSVKGFRVAIYYLKLDYTPKVKLSKEHDGFKWTKRPDQYNLAGNTLDYIVMSLRSKFESAGF